jgi:hypothetical protein
VATAAQWWIIAPVGGGTSGGSSALPNGSVAVKATTAAQINQYQNSFNSGDSSGSNFTYQGKQYNAVAGPFATQAQAQNEIKTGAPTLQQVGEPAIVDVAGAASNAAKTVSDPLNYLADVGDFFHRLTEKATWERVGELAVGALLVYIGVKALTQNTAAGNGAKKSGGLVKKAVEIAAVAPK